MRGKGLLDKLLHPPKGVLIAVPMVSFTALILLFATGQTGNVLSYIIYPISAYSLLILLIAAPRLVRMVKSAVVQSKLTQKVLQTRLGGKYFGDLTFRGSVSIYQGMTVNFLYMVFRIITGIRFASVWFISMAAYYLVLGGLRTYLILNYRQKETRDETRCYRRTAWMLFLLNIPMGGMIVLMVRTNSGCSYPGYVIYLSALYTFYTMIMSVVNLVRYRKLGSPILSAAKVLNFVSAMMSVLGLQTAMISQFSEHGEGYRRMMNAITGGCVYGIVILTAIVMLVQSKRKRGCSQ